MYYQVHEGMICSPRVMRSLQLFTFTCCTSVYCECECCEWNSSLLAHWVFMISFLLWEIHRSFPRDHMSDGCPPAVTGMQNVSGNFSTQQYTESTALNSRSSARLPPGIMCNERRSRGLHAQHSQIPTPSKCKVKISISHTWNCCISGWVLCSLKNSAAI